MKWSAQMAGTVLAVTQAVYSSELWKTEHDLEQS